MSISTVVETGVGSFGNIATLLADGLASYTGLPQPPPAGFQYTACTTTSFTGYSLQQGSSPAVVVGDIFAVQLVTSPSGYAIQVNGDGTVEIFSSGDTSRQSFQYFIYRVASNTLDGPGRVWVNEVAPVWALGPVPTNLPLGTPLVPFSFVTSGYVSSPSGDVLTLALASGTLPPGLSLSGAGDLTGIPTASGTYTFALSATDDADSSTVSPSIQIIVSSNAVVMPDFTGYTNIAALAAAGALGITVVADVPVTSVSIPSGYIVSQSPSAGTLLTESLTCSLTYSIGSPASVFPNVPALPGVPPLARLETAASVSAGASVSGETQSLAAQLGLPPTVTFGSDELYSGLGLKPL